jgi:hypothetical protein
MPTKRFVSPSHCITLARIGVSTALPRQSENAIEIRIGMDFLQRL